MNKINFKHLSKENIFGKDFEEFNKNNILEFRKNIAVLYGPNGTGKTSLSKILSSSEKCSFEIEYKGKRFTHEDKTLFHVINDQNERNIIKGSTEDFVLGENIKREYELKNKIDSIFDQILNEISDKLKSQFKISKKSGLIYEYIRNEKLKDYITALANSKDKGKSINIRDFLSYISNIKCSELIDQEDEKFNFLKNDLNEAKSIIDEILKLNRKIKKNEKIKLIEESEEAISILNKFDYKHECIICDNTIEREHLIEKKIRIKESEIAKLDEETKKMLENLKGRIGISDPFQIKNKIINYIETAEESILKDLKNDIEENINYLNDRLESIFIKDISELIKNVKEYDEIIKSQLVINDEDFLLIQTLIRENIEKDITLIRSEKDNKIILKLGKTNLIDSEREKMGLSAGEQNFISLSFELLKAKNVKQEIIILDDPISSFDSIYKNKIAFLIIKLFEKTDKIQIILTHNLELPRLLEHQLNNSFIFYLFNNTDGEENGFIEVEKKEKDILLYLDKLLNLFRTEILSEVENEKQFLISMIPFLRGYANITGKKDEKDKLTKLMHGYEKDKINLTELYNLLFGHKNFKSEINLSAQDIMQENLEKLTILKEDTEYKLLSKTLYHMFHYLSLRLKVENKLVNKYKLKINNSNSMLSQIIFNAFKEKKDSESQRKRIFLNSRKTLLNEFNHFEGNMNIFQPAIDITESALKKERDSILNFLEELDKFQ